MNTDLLCVPLLCNLFLTSSMHLHVNAVSLCGVHVCILPIPCLCMVYRFCTHVYTVFAHSVHTCTHTMCTTSTYCLSHVCACSVHGVDVPSMMWTFRAWCTRSVHGCSLSISTSQERFQPLYIYMYMYIEVAVCQFIY